MSLLLHVSDETLQGHDQASARGVRGSPGLETRTGEPPELGLGHSAVTVSVGEDKLR